MDPNATLAILRDADADPTDRIDAATDLLSWLRNQGFVPYGLFPRGMSFGGHQAAQAAAIRIVAAEREALIVAGRTAAGRWA